MRESTKRNRGRDLCRYSMRHGEQVVTACQSNRVQKACINYHDICYDTVKSRMRSKCSQPNNE
ncbi:unnamed protein product [Dovyalis caffra]|uniref:Uncharacterized protein n=1 Tax=Dovyalis caffra TaxID=77055 RepID=A0AAV1S902_9ROSI|nr:unnamed protein product [Dovyalis caffra]